jgi:hypothetical protein
MADKKSAIRKSQPATVRVIDKQSVMHAKRFFTGLVSPGADGLCITF